MRPNSDTSSKLAEGVSQDFAALSKLGTLCLQMKVCDCDSKQEYHRKQDSFVSLAVDQLLIKWS